MTSASQRYEPGWQGEGATMGSESRHAQCMGLVLFACAIAATGHASDRAEALPRTEHGHPDLQGLWDFGTKTPFQRPAELGERRAYSEQEARAFEDNARQENARMDAPIDLTTGAPVAGEKIQQEADAGSIERRHDVTRVRGEYRTSIIIDPPNGQVPRRKEFVDYFGQIKARQMKPTDGPDTLDAPTRCLSPLPVPYIYPMPWSPFLQIVQSKDHVVLHTEMIHDARILHLGVTSSKHAAPIWMGHTDAQFEGDTLVVRSHGFRPEQSYAYLLPMSEEFAMTERFTLVSKDELVYEFTIDDPKAYTRPFTGERTFKRADPRDRIVEFACHEGNYSMTGILAGTRKEEQAAQEASGSASKRP